MNNEGILRIAGSLLLLTLCLGILLMSVRLRGSEPGGQEKKAAAGAAEKWPVGYSDTPIITGTNWRVHDINRPHPKVVTPGAPGTQDQSGRPPSDAEVLFDGRSLSKWQKQPSPKDGGKVIDARWKVEDGFMEVVGGSGSIITRENYGDIQLHVEWASPGQVVASSQGRGNSGIMFMGKYEIQVLDSYNNLTYADGQAGAIYGQYPPLVNPALPPGEWQTYDIVFEAPRFEGDKLVRPAYFTVFFNGVLVQNRTASLGATRHRALASYEKHPPEGPILLQDHNNPVRYRNIWVRRLQGYDAQ